MQGKSFLQTAEKLLAHATTEADYRTIIGRSYYAVFLTLREIAFANCDKTSRQKAGIAKSESVGHKPLLAYLRGSDYKPIKRICIDVERLQNGRNKADYNLSKAKFSFHDAEESINTASIVLASLDKIPAIKIGEAMAKYIERMYGKR
ncbi:MAG: HEPN domain-containing protein [Planctomycetes bacterium]|nr:HEPN domain-containing protein [Planctomycetota bacterium]